MASKRRLPKPVRGWGRVREGGTLHYYMYLTRAAAEFHARLLGGRVVPVELRVVPPARRAKKKGG